MGADRASQISNNRIGAIMRAVSLYIGTDKKIVDELSSFLVQFRNEDFHRGLNQFLVMRQENLRKRFPDSLPKIDPVLEKNQNKARKKRDMLVEANKQRRRASGDARSDGCIIN